MLYNPPSDSIMARLREGLDADANAVVDANTTLGILMATINGYEYRRGLRVFQRLIYVSPENRGTRAAVLLVKHLIDWAKSLNAVEIVGGDAQRKVGIGLAIELLVEWPAGQH